MSPQSSSASPQSSSASAQSAQRPPLQLATEALRARGEAFAALVSAAGRPGFGGRSVLATQLRPLPVSWPALDGVSSHIARAALRRQWLQSLRASTARAFREGAGGVLVLVSHEAAKFFDDFDVQPGWQDLPPLQLWAAYQVETYAAGDSWLSASQGALKVLSAWDSATHAAAFQALQSGIARGQLYQACLTYPMATQIPADPAASFSSLLARQPVDHAAWVHLPASVLPGRLELLCFSPERFFSLREGRVQVSPMKGTRRLTPGLRPEQASDIARQLAVDSKDRAENIMIVDLMRNDLGRVCAAGSVRVSEMCAVQTYASVAQMTSTIEGQLRPGLDVWDLLAACFPPGSMTGAPKIEACRWIRQLEAGPRGLYGGTLGWLEPDGSAEFNVVIRSLQVYKDEARWDVGGGIVADSTMDGEWQESRAKAALLEP